LRARRDAALAARLRYLPSAIYSASAPTSGMNRRRFLKEGCARPHAPTG